MRVVKIIDKIERVLIMLLFSAMVLLIFAQVMNRNIVHARISWFEEVARICMVYVLMFAAEIGLRDHSQLNVDSLVKRLPSRLAKAFEWLSAIVTSLFSGVVGVCLVRLLRAQFRMGNVTPALGIPTYIPYASVVVGCLLICFTQVVILANTVVRTIMRKKGGVEA